MVRCGARKQLQTVLQPRDAVREREVMRDEEASVEVRGVVRDVVQSVGDREGEGARGGPTRPAILGPPGQGAHK